MCIKQQETNSIKELRMNKKVIIITDSVGMPRDELKYEDTWIYMLKNTFKNHDFIDKSARGSTTARLVTEGGSGIDTLETYNPDIVILQLGITECAPRLFKKPGLEFYIVSRMPAKLRAKYINHIKQDNMWECAYCQRVGKAVDCPFHMLFNVV